MNQQEMESENKRKTFRTKKDAVKYAQENNQLFFQKDYNTNHMKSFFIDNNYSSVWKDIQNGENSIYESWYPTQPLKLFIDYENDETKTPNLTSQIAKKDILDIIQCISQLFPMIFDSYILKSVPDTKKQSYHIIFNGIYFPNIKNMKLWVCDILKGKFAELFDKKIIDQGIYGDKCLRMLLCSKLGETRPLFWVDPNDFMNDLKETILTKEQTTIEHFKQSALTFIDGSVLFTHIPVAKPRVNKNTNAILTEDSNLYTDKQVIMQYLDLLDQDRFNDRNKWLNVGYILYGISPDNNDLWHHFSKKWGNYQKDDCEKDWNSFVNGQNNYTIHNLMTLVKHDSPEAFEDLIKHIPEHDIQFLVPLDNIMSKFIYRIYGDRFVCSNPEQNEWYSFNGIRWQKENKNNRLRLILINEIFDKITKHRKILIDQDPNDQMISNFTKIREILSRGQILNCLDLEFYNEKFNTICDQNIDLLGFDNGVYDLEKMEFRIGQPSDYITMTTGYDFVPIESSSQEYNEVFDLLVKIFPKEDVRNYTLKALSSCLDGHNRDENFYIWSGKNNSGGNGKTVISDLMTKTLGGYAYNPPVGLITAKKEAPNSPNSALFNLKNKRICMMEEPEVSDSIQVGVFKALTGGNEVSTRELHQTQTSFTPHAKFFMACNKVPALSDTDGGVFRRLKLTEFISTFVEKPTGKPNEYLADLNLKSKLSGYKNIFMNILLHFYKLYRLESLTTPDDVEKATKKFEMDNDIMKQLIMEKFELNSDSKSFIVADDLKDIYKSDYELKSHFGQFSNFKRQFQNSVKKDFVMVKGKLKITGIRIKLDHEDLTDDENDSQN